MITIEECKKHIGNLNLTDKQIEAIRGYLYAFVELSLDYVIDSGIVALSNKTKICRENIIKEE